MFPNAATGWQQRKAGPDERRGSNGLDRLPDWVSLRLEALATLSFLDLWAVQSLIADLCSDLGLVNVKGQQVLGGAF